MCQLKRRLAAYRLLSVGSTNYRHDSKHRPTFGTTTYCSVRLIILDLAKLPAVILRRQNNRIFRLLTFNRGLSLYLVDLDIQYAGIGERLCDCVEYFPQDHRV